MEVEIKALRAQNLRKPLEPYVRVILDEEETGRSKAKDTTRSPVFTERDHNTFVISIPFPAQLAQKIQPEGGYGAIPNTKVRVELWDKNSISNDKFLGQVELDWAALATRRSRLTRWSTPPPRTTSRRKCRATRRAGRRRRRSPRGSSRRSRRPAPGQGDLTLQIRQPRCSR